MEVVIYRDEHGKEPYTKWLGSIKDLRALANIDVRLERVRGGNFGDCKSVGGGVFELRIHYGSGYRIYLGKEGSKIVVLIYGGSKRSQVRDIDKAKGIWKNYKSDL